MFSLGRATSSGDIGREKLTEGLDEGVSRTCCSGTFARVGLPARCAPGKRPPIEGVGEVILALALSKLPETRLYWTGIGGVAGTLLAGRGILFLPPGDGERNVRSDIEALLPRRCIAIALPGLCAVDCMLEAILPKDAVEPLLIMRFVVMSPGKVGVAAAERRAAAAAAVERPASVFAFFAKARAAAEAAALDVLRLTGCLT